MGYGLLQEPQACLHCLSADRFFTALLKGVEVGGEHHKVSIAFRLIGSSPLHDHNEDWQRALLSPLPFG